MADKLPKYDSPPVVETVLGVQFAPLPDFTGAMAGWFWKSYLNKIGGDWNKTQDSVPLVDQFEQFGTDVGWVKPFMGLATTEATRTRIVRADDERMIQIQGSRFILNWRLGVGRYPSYSTLLPEFVDTFKAFSQFVHDAGLPELALNQWEVTYVNHLYRGEMWSTFEDLASIFVGELVPKPLPPVMGADTISANWRYIIGDNAGRLHILLQHAKVPPENREALRLQLVARGPIESNDESELRRCLDLGHESVVQTFTAMTTETAHKHWGRTQ